MLSHLQVIMMTSPRVESVFNRLRLANDESVLLRLSGRDCSTAVRLIVTFAIKCGYWRELRDYYGPAKIPGMLISGDYIRYYSMKVAEDVMRYRDPTFCWWLYQKIKLDLVH